MFLTTNRTQHPWSLLDQLNKELSHVFEDEYGNRSIKQFDWNPLVDVKELDKSFELSVDLPGIKPDAIEITAKDGNLVIQGERKTTSEEKDSEGRVLKSERVFGKFYREFRLPENADEENISAKNKDGELHISIPKKAEVVARKIEVK